MELFCANFADEVTSASKLYLKAIQILAVAVRGLLKRTMGKKLTGVERKALGSDISFIEQVDTTTFVRFENSRESYDKECKEKFQMTAAEYETAKAKRLQEKEERGTRAA